MDPEIYAATERKHADQILFVLIRNVTDAKPDDARFNEAMKDVPRAKWMLFDEPKQISTLKIGAGAK